MPIRSLVNSEFIGDWQQRILNWFTQFGRKDLPWQVDVSPYRVWVSEIMLQQTQVRTVIAYYLRFIQRFPQVQHLAAADRDEVLRYWAGLGYYTRAHYLHAAAQQIWNSGKPFPEDIPSLMELPGVGRSTAGAIRALGFRVRGVILDANVRRVLSRTFMIPYSKNSTAAQQCLWNLAERLTPESPRAADYAQAMMDLGAMVCRSKNPDCMTCPVQVHCQSNLHGKQSEFPLAQQRKKLSVHVRNALVLRNEFGQTLLKRQLDSGLWAGLYIFPEPSQIQTKVPAGQATAAGIIRHRFSHYQLNWSVWTQNTLKDNIIAEPNDIWYDSDPSVVQPAVPAPVARYLENHCMSRTVLCRKYHEELPGLHFSPFPGAKGQEIFDHVSQKAWQEWLRHQTMLINENHLNVMEPATQVFLAEQLQKFLNNESYERPKGYVPPKS